MQRYLLRRAPVDHVDDLLSETMLVIWRRLDSIPAEEPLPWCYAVARRTLANHRRGATRRLKLVERLSVEPTETHDEMRTGEIEDPELFSALHSLGVDDQELLRLWAWEQLEPREIAVALDASPNAISLRLKRAKDKLAEEILRQKTLVAGHISDKHAEEM